jgi:hypothetical protein
LLEWLGSKGGKAGASYWLQVNRYWVDSAKSEKRGKARNEEKPFDRLRAGGERRESRVQRSVVRNQRKKG